jgi:hypothetical protein
MEFNFENTRVGELPNTFLSAQLQYLRHYRQLMRCRDQDENGNPAPYLWHWAIMLQPQDLSLVPVIQAGPFEAMPRWLKGHTLAIIAEDSGEVLAWDK